MIRSTLPFNMSHMTKDEGATQIIVHVNKNM